MNLPFVVCAAITAISAMTSLGFSIAAATGLVGRHRTLALYTCARSVALFVVSGAPLLTGSIDWLLAVACTMIIVQAGDALVGVTIDNRLKTYGPAATAVLNLAAVAWLMLTTV